MAFIERTDLRGRSSKIFQDDIDPARFAYDGQVSTRWHYSSIYGTQTYDNEVNYTPERITAGEWDGWRVQAGPWHYFLGKPNHKTTDGWVGFGGRRGQHALWFRLIQTGFLKWSTRDFWNMDVGNATYTRSNLTDNIQVNSTIINTTEEIIPVEVVATWENLWSTPGGGTIDARWRANGSRLKEEIIINQEGRDWIATNKNPVNHWPGTPLSDIYWGYIFRLDPSDIPRWVVDGVLEDIEGDFDDNNGQSGITLENTLEEALAFMPIDYAFIIDANGDYVVDENDEIIKLRLRKRIYKDGSDYFLLVGARSDLLNALPEGTLIFDPTLDDQVAASADDGYIAGATYDNSDSKGYMGQIPPGAVKNWLRFTDVTGEGTVTTDTAYIEVMCGLTTSNAVNTKISAEDAASPSAPTTVADYNGRTKTTNQVDWDVPGTTSWTSATFYASSVEGAYIDDIIQELLDSYGPYSGGVMQIFLEDDGSGATNRRIRTYDAAASNAAKLHYEYIEAAAGDSIPYLTNIRKRKFQPLLVR